MVSIFLGVNFCKDHRDKIDPLAVEDLISIKLNRKQKLARRITQYRDTFFFHFLEGMFVLLQGLQGVSVTP